MRACSRIILSLTIMLVTAEFVQSRGRRMGVKGRRILRRPMGRPYRYKAGHKGVHHAGRQPGIQSNKQAAFQRGGVLPSHFTSVFIMQAARHARQADHLLGRLRMAAKSAGPYGQGYLQVIKESLAVVRSIYSTRVAIVRMMEEQKQILFRSNFDPYDLRHAIRKQDLIIRTISTLIQSISSSMKALRAIFPLAAGSLPMAELRGAYKAMDGMRFKLRTGMTVAMEAISKLKEQEFVISRTGVV